MYMQVHVCVHVYAHVHVHVSKYLYHFQYTCCFTVYSYIVNREIFAVKIFSQSVLATEIKHAKIKRIQLGKGSLTAKIKRIQLGKGSLTANLFTRKFTQRNIFNMKFLRFTV